MSLLLRLLAILVASAAVVMLPVNAGHAQLAEPTTAPSDVEISALEDFIDGYVAAKTVDLEPPAMSVAVITPGGTITRGYGIADVDTRRAADADTLFRIGSISKLFVWLSAHMLAEEGRLDLDADVNTYLDGFAVPDDGYDRPITMRDLMAHRAGFEDSLRDFLDPDRDIPLREAVSRGFPARVAPPGERVSYSNFGTSLAAYVVERASGMDYYDFVQTRILKPAGMRSTTLHDPQSGINPPALDARMARPHKLEDGFISAQPYLNVRPQAPAGAVAMSANDAAVFMQLLLDGTRLGNGERLLSEEAWARIGTNAFPDAAGGDDMGWGFMLNDVDGAQTIGHGGATSFLSYLFVIPERGVGVFVSVNMNNPNTRVEDFAWSVARRAAGTDAVSTFVAREGDAEAAEEIAGTYLSNRRPFVGAPALLNIGTEIDVAASDGFVILGGRRYAPLTDDVWVALNGFRMRAVRGDDGSVIRLHTSLGSATLERVSFLESSRPLMFGIAVCVLLSITTLLGMWYRHGRASQVTPRGRKAMWIGLVSAIAWLAFVLCCVAAAVTLSSFDLARVDQQTMPPLAFRLITVLLVVLAIQAVVHAIGSYLAWSGSGWTLWRRIHYTIFGLIFVVTMLAFARMDVIGESFYGL